MDRKITQKDSPTLDDYLLAFDDYFDYILEVIYYEDKREFRVILETLNYFYELEPISFSNYSRSNAGFIFFNNIGQILLLKRKWNLLKVLFDNYFSSPYERSRPYLYHPTYNPRGNGLLFFERKSLTNLERKFELLSVKKEKIIHSFVEFNLLKAYYYSLNDLYIIPFFISFNSSNVVDLLSLIFEREDKYLLEELFLEMSFKELRENLIKFINESKLQDHWKNFTLSDLEQLIPKIKDFLN